MNTRPPLKQAGFTIIETIVVVTILGTVAAFSVPAYQKHKERELVEATQTDVDLIQKALYSYHLENRRFPGSLQELRDGEYYFGRMETPYGTPYELTLNAQGTAAKVNFDGPNERITKNIAGGLAQARPVGESSVEVSMGRPSKEAQLSTYLHRTEVPGHPEYNTMETDINMNGNNVVGVGTLEVEDVQAIDVYAENTTTNVLDVRDSISIGGAQINATANGMEIQATETRFVGNVGLQGDLVSNNGNMSGFDTVEVNTLSAQDVNADTVSTDRLSATNAQINSATIETLNGETLTYDEGDFNTFNAEELTSSIGTIESLSGSTLDYAEGQFTDLSSTTLTASDATVDDLSGNTFTYNTGTFNSVNVNGTTTTDNLNANVIEAQNANMVDVQSGSITADIGRFRDYSASNLTFESDLTVNGELNAQDVNVDNRLRTNRLESNSSVLGGASADSLDVSGEVSANSITVSGNADIDTVLFNEAQGGNVNVNSVSADSGVFSTFEASSISANDVSSSLSSINNNHSLIEAYKSQWDSCVSSGGCK